MYDMFYKIKKIIICIKKLNVIFSRYNYNAQIKTIHKISKKIIIIFFLTLIHYLLSLYLKI